MTSLTYRAQLLNIFGDRAVKRTDHILQGNFPHTEHLGQAPWDKVIFCFHAVLFILFPCSTGARDSMTKAVTQPCMTV